MLRTSREPGFAPRSVRYRLLRRLHRRARRRAAGMDEPAHLADDHRDGRAHQHTRDRRARRAAPSGRPVRRCRRFRSLAEFRHRSDRHARTLQSGDRGRVPRDRAFLARRTAGALAVVRRLGQVGRWGRRLAKGPEHMTGPPINAGITLQREVSTMSGVTRRSVLAATVAAALIAIGGGARAQDTIKVGGLATLEGAFTVLGEDSMRGLNLALKEHNATAGGKKIELITGSSNATPDSAVNAARKLVEQDGVQILVGPLSGDEGLAVKQYAKTQPQVTFINGTSAAQDTTLRDPAPNFFRFTTDGAQWQAGLGEYAFNQKGYKKIVTIAEDYSFPYTQVFGFMLGYCKAGGHVVDKFWVPIGNKDFSSIVAS